MDMVYTSNNNGFIYHQMPAPEFPEWKQEKLLTEQEQIQKQQMLLTTFVFV